MPGYSYRAPEAHRTSPSLILAARKAARRLTSMTSTRFGNEDEVEADDFVDDDVAAAAAAAVPADAHGHEKKSQGWGRGIRSDFCRTVRRHWIAESTNFTTKTVAVSFFLFIAVIAPSITFGAVYAKRTNNYIGASELLLGTAWCGIFYSLVAGMPLMINGATGPVLTFQAVTYELSGALGVPFLTFNAWVGLWVAAYLVLGAVVDLNRLIKYATRFTDEIFAFLIVSIYILDAIGNPTSKVGLLHYFNPSHPHNEEMLAADPTYDYMTVALLSLLLGLGTAFFAMALRRIRHSAFCCNDYVRSIVTDFAITISVVTFTALQHTVFKEVPTEELNVPDTFAPTFNCCTTSCDQYWPTDCPDIPEPYGRRPWLVDLTDFGSKSGVAVIFIAAGPAALAFILAFLDNGITWHIVNHPSNRITHGDAYNYDTCISAVMVAINSLLGLPWLVASTVPCILHVSALSDKTKDGETTGVQETRLTGFFTHVLVLGTCFALNVLRLIPLPVLYGVFLFMGLVALPAQQFWQRILLFFQQPAVVRSRQADTVPYIKYVAPFHRVHLFTIIQLFFFALLYVVKNFKMISIAFPLFILLCIPVRIYLLPKIFTDDELTLLDGSPEEIEDWILVNEADKLGDGAIMVNTGCGGGDDGDDSVDDAIEKLETVPQDEGDAAGMGIIGTTCAMPPTSKRRKQISGLSAKSNGSRGSGRRIRQTSMNSVGSFFERRRTRRDERERQLSHQSMDLFMRQSGLAMPPEVPDAIEDGNDDTDDCASDISNEA